MARVVRDWLAAAQAILARWRAHDGRLVLLGPPCSSCGLRDEQGAYGAGGLCAACDVDAHVVCPLCGWYGRPDVARCRCEP